MGGYHRPVCVETFVGPLQHFSVEGWGRQQHNIIPIIFGYWPQSHIMCEQIILMSTFNHLVKLPEAGGQKSDI